MATFSIKPLFMIILAILILEAEFGLGLNPKNLKQHLGERAIRAKRQLAYKFGDGIEYIVPEVREVFSCQDRDYGYYADVANNCQVFHVCLPPDQHFSFFCPNQTLFDQRLLICQDQYTATPCQEAERYYVINQNFGQLDPEKYVLV